MVTRKSRSEIERMRRAGRVVGEILDIIEAEIRPGVSTAHLDALAEAHIRKSGATPSFKGYPGINPRRPFPASVCISIDDEIVHGIPGERTIRAGQIVSVDAGAIVDGWHGDGARTFYVGDPPPRVAQLIDLTRSAMMAGIAAAVPGNHIEDSSSATASGPRCTRSPRSRTSGPVGPAASSRLGCAWPSSRCSRSVATTRGSSPTTGRSSPRTARWRPISSIRSP
jgi:methionyl aminopeptidase